MVAVVSIGLLVVTAIGVILTEVQVGVSILLVIKVVLVVVIRNNL